MSDGRLNHRYRALDVPVPGGTLRAGVWEPTDAAPGAPTVLLVHGVTASHLAWPFVVDRLPGVRVIAPDLRGRGRSNGIEGAAGMAAHADDLATLLDAVGVDRAVVVGHSMGGFVSVVFAHRHPERVSRLLLVDGGLPLDVPSGLSADELVAGILGPTAARLSMRFADVGEYLEFWRRHPAFAAAWTAELEEYLAYDLVDDGAGAFRPATSYATTADDTVDMNTGTALPEALAGLRHPTRVLTAPRGLQDDPPGLYAPEYLAGVLEAFPEVTHERIDGVNHYTIVMSPDGAAVVATAVREELAAAATTA
ncbi:alpha/beta hydrolase [Microbacterium sp. M3]|uniref:Alpha/beta hydrolase n=1 Tax=Microbacterium arthrosphaerae TaxID=792652 RepID=A0ABU4H106_9MICO|nr:MULTISPECIES: alpha/beta hydrolase [Microbacterium]MDW4572940.1 alpha/beta hydrolase [Microbacterium arthrosphaerae]MDW7606795.1 alpha/beta hydrolase [Microbacterium sp. M3]